MLTVDKHRFSSNLNFAQLLQLVSRMELVSQVEEMKQSLVNLDF